VRTLHRLGLGLLGLVALAFLAFGVDDLTLDAPPPIQQRWFERIGGVAPEVEALSLAAFDGQGGLFLAAGSALLFLAVIPVRRGERWAIAAAALVVGFGCAGIILAVRQLGGGHGPMDALLGLGLAGCALCSVGGRAKT
jgi:hypothetical protein